MGPLKGIRAIEFVGVGPAPFCGMLLSDMGADVLRIGRKSGSEVGLDIPFEPHMDILARGRRSIALDLKHADAAEFVLELVSKADILFEGHRPGVMERLNLGPEHCAARNARLVYGRMTGWGQSGPYAIRAGHDINYIGLSGALHTIGRRGAKPVPPSNLVGDFGGGGMLLAVGLLAAVIEAGRSGKGQVVDASMVEGSSLLMAMHHSLRAMGIATDERGCNSYDGGAHFNDVYETLDGQFMAVGAAEPAFYQRFLAGMGLEPTLFADQWNRALWPDFQERVAAVFRTRTQAYWCSVFDELDACVTPVLPPGEAHRHHHNVARESFVEVAGVTQPAPAPRFSRTPSKIGRPPTASGEGGKRALREWGISEASIHAAKQAGLLA